VQEHINVTRETRNNPGRNSFLKIVIFEVVAVQSGKGQEED